VVLDHLRAQAQDSNKVTACMDVHDALVYSDFVQQKPGCVLTGL
jgi:hypothetical protein